MLSVWTRRRYDNMKDGGGFDKGGKGSCNNGGDINVMEKLMKMGMDSDFDHERRGVDMGRPFDAQKQQL